MVDLEDPEDVHVDHAQLEDHRPDNHQQLGDDAEWPWLATRLTDANAVLAEALIAAGVVLDDPALRQRGLDSLEWLLGYETHDGHLSPTPVGGRGPGDARPAFDQQPIEVATLADACARRGPRSAAALARGHPIACSTMMSVPQ